MFQKYSFNDVPLEIVYYNETSCTYIGGKKSEHIIMIKRFKRYCEIFFHSRCKKYEKSEGGKLKEVTEEIITKFTDT